MSIRRQGFQWVVADLGNLPPKDIELLENRPQSVFYSKIGSATITNRLTTKGDEFLVLQYIGSTPGIYGLGNNWNCLLYTSPSPRDRQKSRMPSSA